MIWKLYHFCNLNGKKRERSRCVYFYLALSILLRGLVQQESVRPVQIVSRKSFNNNHNNYTVHAHAEMPDDESEQQNAVKGLLDNF